jgi:Skp family chaperone for outer membrane proteins
MKLIYRCLPVWLVLALCLAPGLTLTAQAQVKIATVDMRKLLNGYWKTKQANAALDARKADLRKELKDMADGLDKAQADYKLLLTQASDPAISEEERTRRHEALNDKTKQINDSKAAFDQFSRQAEVQLQDQVQRMTSNLIADIQAAVGAQAKISGVSMVLNGAADSVIYNKGDNDLTPDVLKQLNAGAPIDLNPSTSTNQTALPLTSPLGSPTGKP